MTGLEKMQSQILDEARRSADEILKSGRKGSPGDQRRGR